MTLRLLVRDVAVEAEIGVNPEELFGPQPLLISLEVTVVPPADPSRDDLSCVVDYARCLTYLHEEAGRQRLRLLETLAHRIAVRCFDDLRVESVRVIITKPSLLPGTAAVGVDWHFLRDIVSH